MTNSKYSVKVKPLTKELEIEFIDRFTEGESANFFNEYTKEVKSINPYDYTLILDAKEMKVLQPKVVDILEEAYKLYKETSFKKVIIKVSDNPTVKLQLNRILRKTGLTAEFVEELND